MSKRGDNRLGSLLAESKNESAEKRAKVAILGYPYDEGVERNGGRPGAKLGPASFRKILPKIGPLINPEFGININCIELCDAGDVPSGSTLEETHPNLESSVKKLLDDGFIPIIV